MNDHVAAPVPPPGPTCAAFVDLLPLLGEETLGADEAQRLRQHLQTCPYCQTQRAIYDRIAKALYRYGEPPEVGPFSSEEVVQMLHDPSPAPLAPPAPFPAARARQVRRLVSGFSVLAAVLVITLLTATFLASHPSVGNGSHPLVGTTASTTPTPEQYAATLLQHLTLDEKLGQMLIVQFSGLQPTPDAVQMMRAQGAGGVLFFGANIHSADQIRSLTTQLEQLGSIPPLLAVDQEGGMVNRLAPIVGPVPPASSLHATQAAEAQGKQDATWLHEFGFNLNLAPVVDVGTANPQLYERTFGSDPDTVAALAGAYLAGLQQSGQVTGTLKHFPGLGDTTTDPHIGLPSLSRSKAEWERIDLEPYRVLLKGEDVRAILVTPELIPAVDPTYPAPLSPALINGVLRGELGFGGVVITDSLYMSALNTTWSVPQAAILAIKAGADIVIGPSNPQMVQEVMDAFKQALADGTLSQASIDTAVTRILALKIRMGLIPLQHQ